MAAMNWRSMLRHPAVVASIIGAAAVLGAAISGSISGAISACYQSDADKVKANVKRETDQENLTMTMLLEIIKNTDEKERATKTKLLLQSGILPDRDGKICRAFVGQGCKESGH